MEEHKITQEQIIAEEQEAYANELQGELTEAEAALGARCAELRNLEAERDGLREEVRLCRESIRDHISEKDKLYKQIASLNQQVDRLEKKTHELLEELNELKLEQQMNLSRIHHDKARKDPQLSNYHDR